MEEKEYINAADLCEKLETSRMTLNTWRKTIPDFPKPIQIARKLLWKRSEVDAFIESKKKIDSPKEPE